MASTLHSLVSHKREVDNARALLLDPQQSADFLGISLRKYYELRSAGVLPPPVRLGERIVRQRRSDLIAFVEQLETDSAIPEPPSLAKGRRRKAAAQKVA